MIYEIMTLAATFVIITVCLVLTGMLLVQYKVYKQKRKEIRSLMVVLLAFSAYGVAYLSILAHGDFTIGSLESTVKAIGLITFFAFLTIVYMYMKEFDNKLLFATLNAGSMTVGVGIVEVVAPALTAAVIIHGFLIFVYTLLFTFLLVKFIIFVRTDRVDIKAKTSRRRL